VTLAYLHGEGVVHRDLKPANIIVQPNGNPVLVDFGIVGRFAGTSNREALGDTSQAIGTIAYASPEQLQGDFVDARTDLYALGCVLFEILTGRLPFDPDVLFLCQPNGLHGEPGFTDAALAEDDLDAPATIGQRRERIDEPGARRLAAGNSGSVEIGP
jgi:serine/threonine protein kinase